MSSASYNPDVKKNKGQKQDMFIPVIQKNVQFCHKMRLPLFRMMGYRKYSNFCRISGYYMYTGIESGSVKQTEKTQRPGDFP